MDEDFPELSDEADENHVKLENGGDEVIFTSYFCIFWPKSCKIYRFCKEFMQNRPLSMHSIEWNSIFVPMNICPQFDISLNRKIQNSSTIC